MYLPSEDPRSEVSELLTSILHPSSKNKVNPLPPRNAAFAASSAKSSGSVSGEGGLVLRGTAGRDISHVYTGWVLDVPAPAPPTVNGWRMPHRHRQVCERLGGAGRHLFPFC